MGNVKYMVSEKLFKIEETVIQLRFEKGLVVSQYASGLMIDDIRCGG